jgi:hypothetical protein
MLWLGLRKRAEAENKKFLIRDEVHGFPGLRIETRGTRSAIAYGKGIDNNNHIDHTGHIG